MNWEILQKYIKGNCSKDELRELSQWLNEDPANEDFFSSFVEFYKYEEYPPIKIGAREAWEQFKENSDISSESGNTTRSNFAIRVLEQAKIHSSFYCWSFSIAAVVVLVVTILFFGVYDINSVESKITESQKVVTDKGQGTNLKLIDGSEIILNSENKIAGSYNE